MPCYVDKMKTRYGRMIMSHLLADSLEELHEMAGKIGIKRKWFQPGSTPHYDICQSKKELALSRGAIEVDREKVVELIRHWRNKSQCVGAPLPPESSGSLKTSSRS